MRIFHAGNVCASGPRHPACLKRQNVFMPHPSLLPAISEVLQSIRRKQGLDSVVHLILEKACHLAQAAHGSFALVDHEARRLTISNVFGSDWTLKKKLCQLELGRGLTGKVAATGQPILCRDTTLDPDYYPLFSYVRSELVVPVVVKERVWGVINIDGSSPNVFDETTLELLVVFAELAASAIMLQLEMADQDRLYRKLLQSEKLASLGEALAGIAHEINNPLTSILCYSTLVAQDGALSDDNRRAVEVVASEAQRAAALIRGLLEFSRKETGRREYIDAHTLVQEVASLKRYQLRMNGIKLHVSRPTEPLLVHVCPQQIKQVLHNLITNAEQAMPKLRGSGVIRIGFERRDGNLRIGVSDNGTGVPPELQPQIFDPFFTTKAPGEGTGLGLSICHGIMEAHGGTIQLASSSPQGTTFNLDLPLATAASVIPAPIASDKPPEPVPNGRVLIVDDEPHILESLAAFLAKQQLQVHCAGSAIAGLGLLKQEKFDLVISDLRMPEMDGLQFHEAAARLDAHYERRFVFMSGYLMRTSVKAHLAATDLPCLEKPFSFDELQRTLARLLPPVESMPKAS
jgi:signal transduction histidine kinase/CheY-like chemotaxis protein